MLLALLILQLLMYLGTLFLCIYALKQWQKCLIHWKRSDSECLRLEDRVEELERYAEEYNDFGYGEDEDYGPDLIPDDLLASEEIPWYGIVGSNCLAPSLKDINSNDRPTSDPCDSLHDLA